ncbi:unnamed protein product, partial [Ectocarpus sp. 12 AP-2014]
MKGTNSAQEERSCRVACVRARQASAKDSRSILLLEAEAFYTPKQRSHSNLMSAQASSDQVPIFVSRAAFTSSMTQPASNDSWRFALGVIPVGWDHRRNRLQLG